jgi:hypothetical protein
VAISSVTSGITGSNYYLQVIMNTVTYGASFTNCAIDCSVGFLGMDMPLKIFSTVKEFGNTPGLIISILSE